MSETILKVSGVSKPLAMLWRWPQPAWPHQHDAYHGQCDEKLAQDGRVESAICHGLQRACNVAQYLR